MKSMWTRINAALMIALVCCFAGCKPEASSDSATSSTDEHSDHAHEHPTEGPHGGSLIELGEEQYHAELVHDDAAQTATIYLLDAAGKTAVAIADPSVRINLTHEGEAMQFELAASRQETDPEGQSSMFTSSDASLAEHLDHAGDSAQLVVTIEGTQFRGSLAAHDHDHEGHDH